MEKQSLGTAYIGEMMELRSGSISSGKSEETSNVNKEIIEDIWLVIEKRVSTFFLEEKKARNELLDELEMMREENTTLRKDLEEFKLFLSSQVSTKTNISNEEPNVTKGYAVAIEKDRNQSAKDKIEVQLTDVRNAQKVKFYNERASIVDQPKPIEANINPTPAKSDVLVTPTINIRQDKPTTPPTKNTSTLWPRGTTLIVGDSMLGGIEESRMGPRRKVRSFPGATIADMHQYLIPLLRKKPSRLVAHVGTNDASFSDAKTIADDLLNLHKFIQSELPECGVIISSPINRLDDPKKAVTIRNVNVIMKNTTEINLIDNSNITAKHLGKRKLHLNLSGSSMLARNILEKLRSL